MKKLLLALFFLVITQLTFSASIFDSASSKDYVSSLFPFQEIRQNENLHNCRIKISNHALYMCEDNFYIFEKDSSGMFTIRTRKEGPVIDADITLEDIAFANRINLTLLSDDDTRTDPNNHIRFSHETPIFLRINNKGDYGTFTMLIRMLDPIEFKIQHFCLDKAPRAHKIKFPTQDLKFEVKEDSFRDMMVWTDPVLGNDYVILGLKEGYIYIFKSFFEDAQLELVRREEMKVGYQIEGIKNAGSLLFVLLVNREERKLSLEILRMVTPNGFRLLSECNIDIASDYVPTSLPAEIKVNSIKNTFLIMINFPGSHMLLYPFQIPTQAIYKLQCPTNPETLTYSTLAANKVGYSFDYTVLTSRNKISKQGIIFSPFSDPSIRSSYFLPFCMPNHYIDNEGNCQPCREGFSKGGHQSSCQVCENLAKNGQDVIMMTQIDPMTEACPIRCRNSSRYGRDCQEQDKYAYVRKLFIPTEDLPVFQTNGIWGLNCAAGQFFDEQTGICVKSTQEIAALDDNCAIINDCMNCSMTQSCLWCQGSCKKARQCNPKFASTDKKEIENDFLALAIHCNLTKPCGPDLSLDMSGSLAIHEFPVPKNQVCRWHLAMSGNETKQLTLTINNTAINPWYNTPNLFLEMCQRSWKGGYRCGIVVLREGTSAFIRQVIGFNFTIYLWFGEGMSDNTSLTLSVKYGMHDGWFGMGLFGIMFRVVRFLLVCVIVVWCIGTVQKFIHDRRRRRLLRQIQGLELFRLVDDEQGEAPQIASVQEIMEDNAIVGRAVYNSGSNDFQQTDCPICLEGFREQETVAKLQCRHSFHINCLRDWVNSITNHQAVKCPVCNLVLV